MEHVLKSSAAKKVLVDHHLDPEEIFDYSFSYPDASSTCELIYEFIVAMGNSLPVSKAIAECLYTGIMTDTQSFRLPNVSPGLHTIAADLIAAGAENYRIYENVYENASEHRLRLLGYCLKDKLKVLHEYRTAYIALSEKELDAYQFQPGDTEGIVNYALSVRGMKMAAFFSERDGVVKISFRSRADFSVKDFSAKHFDGGGHKNASGGKSTESLEATVKRFLSLLPAYQNELQTV
jgi:phosphoesterase RecJ-like protein